MGISVKVKDTNFEFICSNYENWKEITNNCPIVEKVFRNEVCKDKDGNFYLRKYIINHSDPNLRKMVSEVTKRYLGNDIGVYDAVGKVAKEICKTAHKSMSKKKDLEVSVLWR